MNSEEEVSAQCPYCFSNISFVLDTFSGGQSYIEDCEVCCKPIQVSFQADPDEGVTGLSTRRLDE